MGTHERESESHIPSRRQALCLGAALVTVPAGVLALAVPAPTLAAPVPIDPLERARAAWLAFAAAMDELAAPGDGWMLEGAGARRAAHGRPAEAWVYASRLTYEWQADSRYQRGGILTERAEPIELRRRTRGGSQPEARA